MKHRLRSDRQAGFAMIVAVMALLLLGLSFVAGLRYMGPKVSLGHQQGVGALMSRSVQRSLWAFVASNKRLPCPADGTQQPNSGSTPNPLYGVEQTTGTGCVVTGSNGVVPWKTIGVQQGDAQDAWGNFLGYAVTPSLANGTPYKSIVPRADSIQVSVNSVVSKNAYTLLSFGPDGGSYSLSGQTTPVTAASQLPTSVTANEGNNRLATAFEGNSAFYAPAASGGAIGGQWVLFENSTQICADINGKTTGNSAPYCNIPKVNQNGLCGSSGVCNPLSSTAGLSTTISGSSSNPNGVSSGAGLVSGLSNPVLSLGNPSSTNGGTTAPTLTGSSQACAWVNPVLPLTTQTLRVYFEFSTVGTTAGDGFTFAMLPGATSLANGTPCGGTAGDNTNEGSYLGFAGIADSGLPVGGSMLGGFATATASIASGALSSVTMAHWGSGYLWVPPVELTGGLGTGTTTAATAQVSAMTISGITMTNAGYGYIATAGTSPAPVVTIAGGAGAGYLNSPTVIVETAASTGCTTGCANATVVAAMSNGHVGLSVPEGGGGSGYLRAPAVSISGAATTGCTVGCADAFGAYTTINGSTGTVTGAYISGDSCTSGCGAASVSSMAITGVTLTNGGSGYLLVSGGTGYGSGNPTVLIFNNGLGGSGATATATASGGSVTSVTVTNGGTNYTSASITIASAGIAYATIDNINGGAVSDVTLNDPGATYPANTNFQFNLPAPTNCTSGCSTAVAQASTSNTGVITGVTIVSGGAGYSTTNDSGNFAPVTNATHTVATAQATIVDGVITGISLATSGTQTPTVTVVTAPGDNPTSTASITATVNNSGVVTGLNITSVGAGYLLVPTITISAPSGCSGSCAAATAQVSSMSVLGINVTSTTGQQFTAMPSIGVAAPNDSCTSPCYAATAAANTSITGISVVTPGQGYSSAPTVTIPPSNVTPKTAIEFRTYHYTYDPYYDDYGYHNDWGFFGTNPGTVSSLYTTSTGIEMPGASISPQGLGGNIRHDDNAGCSGTAIACPYEYMGQFFIDAMYHDVTYHYSTNTTNSGWDNTAYTVSPSCDTSAQGVTNAAQHGGGFVAGGLGTAGALGSTASAFTGGCSYNNSGAGTTTNIVTANGPISAVQSGTTIYYHPVRVEAQRYCNSTCSSCGNQGVAGDNYMLVSSYIDCDSAALGGRSCSDMTQNLLISGGAVFAVPVTAGGSGYSSTTPPTVQFIGGGGIGATATANVGGVTSVTVSAPGSGYLTPPTVTIASGNGAGSGATAVATINGGIVKAITVVSTGSGYTAAPIVTVGTAASTGCTSNCTNVSATATVANSDAVAGVTITAGGSGYTSAPTVQFTSGSGSGAAASAVLSGLPFAAANSTATPKGYLAAGGTNVYTTNFCTLDPGVTTWTTSQQGLAALDNILVGFTAGAGSATRGELIRNLQLGTF